MYFAVIITMAISLSPVALSAQSTKPSILAELVAYNGPDREQLLVAAPSSRRGSVH